jgi:hypothetical protein
LVRSKIGDVDAVGHVVLSFCTYIIQEISDVV